MARKPANKFAVGPSSLARAQSPSGQLSLIQDRFLNEYMIDLDASAAARRVDIHVNTAGEWLSKPHVQAELGRRLQLRAERLQINGDRVLTELARIGFSDIRRVVSWKTVKRKVKDPKTKRTRTVEEQVLRLNDSALLDDAAAASISEIKQTPHGVAIKFHDKKGALDSLGKHLGLFQDTPEVRIPVRFVIEGAPVKGRDDEPPAIEGEVIR